LPIRHRELLQIDIFTTDSSSVARLGRDRLIVDRGTRPELSARSFAEKRDLRHKKVPRIGGRIADSRSVDPLRRDRFIVDRGRRPDSTIIQ